MHHLGLRIEKSLTSNSNVIKRSLLISFSERYSITALQFISVVVLARMLTPQDIGIYTIGLAIIGIAHMVRDFGIGKYLIQEKELTREKIAAAFGLTICIAWGLGVCIYFLAPYIAIYYKEEGVEQVIHVVLLNFFIIPFGAMAPDLLKRSLSFGTLFKINVSATIANVVLGVVLAYLGYGFMAMAWASVANVTVGAMLAQFYLPRKYRTLPKLANSIKILRFGVHVVGANFMQQLEASILNLLVGKILGFASLGYLSRGQGFVKIYGNTVEKAITPVIHAQLAQKYRNGNDLELTYDNVINYVTLVGWFCLGFMGLMSFNLIRILYGGQWDVAVPIASILCLVGCAHIPGLLGRRFLIATGKVKINFWLTVVFSSIQILLIWMLVDYGLQVLLSSFLIVSATNSVITNFIIFKKFGFSPNKFVRIVTTNMVITSLALVYPAYIWLTRSYNENGLFVEVIISGLVATVVWLLLVYIFNHPLKLELEKFRASTISRMRGIAK